MQDKTAECFLVRAVRRRERRSETVNEIKCFALRKNDLKISTK
jgi:hypothetical protein